MRAAAAAVAGRAAARFVCLQETKLADAAFTALLGAELAAARVRACPARRSAVERRGDPVPSRAWTTCAGRRGGAGFPHPEARAVSATCGGIRVFSVYAPNGRVPDSDHYRYKLAWFAALREVVAVVPRRRRVRRHEHCPTDADVFDPHAYIGQTHVTPPEREALASSRRSACTMWCAITGRPSGCSPTGTTARECFTRPGDAHRPRAGQRAGNRRVRAAWVDRQARKGTLPSDHAPVIVDLDEAPDGDIGPVVPPPRRGIPKRGAFQAPQSTGEAKRKSALNNEVATRRPCRSAAGARSPAATAARCASSSVSRLSHRSMARFCVSSVQNRWVILRNLSGRRPRHWVVARGRAHATRPCHTRSRRAW